MKRRLALAALTGLGALAISQASANLIVNGSFESGITGFSSGYGNVTGIAGGLATGGDAGGGEGLYAVGTDPHFYHSAFPTATAQDGSYMMIVNGSTKANLNVWSGNLSSALVAGQTYLFSAWVMNVYHDGQVGHEDATLQFSIGGNSLGTITAPDLDVWHQFTATYTPSTSGELPTSVDLAVNAYANDFALDNISLTAVPEPTTMIAGALLLLPFGASTIRILRKKVAA
jgi:hypothetical protein